MTTEGSETGVPKDVLEKLGKAHDMAIGDKETPKDTKVKKEDVSKETVERLIKKLENL